jgi:hypothetical protein
MKRLMLIAAAAFAFVTAPASGACAAAAGDPCLNDPLVAPVSGKVYFADTDRLNTFFTGTVYADYNADGERQAREPVVPIERDGTFVIPVDTRRLAPGATTVAIRMRSSYDRPGWEFNLQCLGEAAGCARTVTVAPGTPTEGVDFPVVGTAQISGTIWDD